MTTKVEPTVEKCHTCHKPLITDWHEGDCIKCARDKVLGTEPTVEKWEETHQPVIEAMKKIGYGLLKDGETFYQLGYELEPRQGITFTMSQAYVIAHSVQEAKAEREVEVIEALKPAVEAFFINYFPEEDGGYLTVKFFRTLSDLLDSLKQEEDRGEGDIEQLWYEQGVFDEEDK